MIQLTPHFTLEELTHSDTAEARDIDNTAPIELMDNAVRLAEGAERVRKVLGVPMRVTSGYRCEDLERIIAQRGYMAWCQRHGKAPCEMSWREYYARKSHPKFLALDFRAPDFGTPEQIVRKLAEHIAEIGADQLIVESTWVHLSFPEVGHVPRLQVLTADETGTNFKRGLG